MGEFHRPGHFKNILVKTGKELVAGRLLPDLVYFFQALQESFICYATWEGEAPDSLLGCSGQLQESFCPGLQDPLWRFSFSAPDR